MVENKAAVFELLIAPNNKPNGLPYCDCADCHDVSAKGMALHGVCNCVSGFNTVARVSSVSPIRWVGWCFIFAL